MSKNEWEAVCHHTDTCGLTGTAAFFMSIPGSRLLVNGPLWCYFYALRYLENAAGVLSDKMLCTQPAGTAVVYGTEEDLLRGFEQVKNSGEVERLFVENNCSISMIGDDIAGIAERAELPWPVYTTDSGGIHGGFAGGFERAFLRIIEEMEPKAVRPRTVNLLGLTPFLLKGAADTEEIIRLLRMTGAEILSAPGAGSTWEEIMQAPAAALNIVCRDELGLAAAKEMERRFGTPYISVGLPYGIKGTGAWIEKILAAFPGDASKVRAEMEERGAYLSRRSMDMSSLWGPLWFDRILVAALPSEAAGIAEAVRGEWADTERLTIHFQHEKALRPAAADDIRIAGRDDAAIRHDLEEWPGGLLLASAHEASRLIRLGKTFGQCNIAYPTYDEMFLADLPFCGLRGAGWLLERLWNVKLRGHLAKI